MNPCSGTAFTCKVCCHALGLLTILPRKLSLTGSSSFSETNFDMRLEYSCARSVVTTSACLRHLSVCTNAPTAFYIDALRAFFFFLMKPYSAVTRARKHVYRRGAFAAVSRSADFSRDVTVLCYLRHSLFQCNPL